MGRELRLLVPGLFGPAPWSGEPSEPQVAEGLPRPRQIERFLARADALSTQTRDPWSALFAAFDLPISPGRDLPSAPFCRLAEAPDSDLNGYWLHAEPVHLRADRDRVRLFDSHFLDLDAAEADALISLFNAHFTDADLRLSCTRAERWYLRVDTEPDLTTTPIDRVISQPIDPFLPSGRDARRWGALLNETQMLLHQSTVNQRREASGRPTVNSIWPWGGGKLPSPPEATPDFTVYASAPLAVGLARWAGAARADAGGGLPPFAETAASGNALVFWDDPLSALRMRDAEGWRAAILELDRWLAAAPGAMRHGELAQLTLDPGLGTCYRLTRHAYRRIWRRPVRFTEHLVEAD